MNQLLSDADKRALVSRILKDMWSHHCFSICDVDKCLEILELQRPACYGDWHKLHCVHWDKMPKGLPEKVMGSVLQELTKLNISSLIDMAFTESAKQEGARNGNLLLLGMEN